MCSRQRCRRFVWRGWYARGGVSTIMITKCDKDAEPSA
jgi:hypothetical protein